MFVKSGGGPAKSTGRGSWGGLCSGPKYKSTNGTFGQYWVGS